MNLADLSFAGLAVGSLFGAGYLTRWAQERRLGEMRIPLERAWSYHGAEPSWGAAWFTRVERRPFDWQTDGDL